jgi:multicomponent Na+:H+ antiporter subunit E
MSLFARVALLLAVWLLAWGEVTTANVLTGLVLIGVLLVAFPAPRPRSTRGRLRPAAIARLVGYILHNLVVSNVLVARQILARRSRVNTGVIRYEVECGDDFVITLIANIIALTPGTMTVDATRQPPVLLVHFLLLDDVETARQSIAHLERLVVAAAGIEAANASR